MGRAFDPSGFPNLLRPLSGRADFVCVERRLGRGSLPLDLDCLLGVLTIDPRLALDPFSLQAGLARFAELLAANGTVPDNPVLTWI